jgi:hypothetical protein
MMSVGDLPTLLSVSAERAWLACIMAHTASLRATPSSTGLPPAEQLLQSATAAFASQGAVALPDCAVACLAAVETAPVDALSLEGAPQESTDLLGATNLKTLRLQALMLEESGGWEVSLESLIVLEEGASTEELLRDAERLGAQVAHESLRVYREVMLL